MRELLLHAARALVPAPRRAPLRQRLRRLARPAWLGTLRRTTPLSDRWGWDRGTPIDRHYIEAFLAEHRADIRGTILEVQDARYARRFGPEDAVRDVLDIDPANPRATVVADLTAADAIPADRYDCFILTQTLHLIGDPVAALRHARRILRPGGVLLATVPSLSRVDRPLEEIDYWRFTPAGCRRLFGTVFAADEFTVRAYGNVLAGTAFLNGLAAEELTPRELAVSDRYFPVVVCVRVVKA